MRIIGVGIVYGDRTSNGSSFWISGSRGWRVVQPHDDGAGRCECQKRIVYLRHPRSLFHVDAGNHRLVVAIVVAIGWAIVFGSICLVGPRGCKAGHSVWVCDGSIFDLSVADLWGVGVGRDR